MARILIAEDNAEIRSLLSRVLERDGHAVEAVADGQLAIERLATETYDLILLDFMMPVVSGFDVIDWLREHGPQTACVIVLTAAVHALKTFNTAQVFAAITKPFDVYELRDTVRKCLEARNHETVS